jgi:hypothetical protein
MPSIYTVKKRRRKRRPLTGYRSQGVEMLSNLKVAKDPVLAAAEEWRGDRRAIALGLSRSTSTGRRVFAELTTGERGLSGRNVGFSAR